MAQEQSFVCPRTLRLQRHGPLRRLQRPIEWRRVAWHDAGAGAILSVVNHRQCSKPVGEGRVELRQSLEASANAGMKPRIEAVQISIRAKQASIAWVDVGFGALMSMDDAERTG